MIKQWKKEKERRRRGGPLLETWRRIAYPPFWNGAFHLLVKGTGPYFVVTVEEVGPGMVVLSKGKKWALHRTLYQSPKDLLGSTCRLTYHATRAKAKHAGTHWLKSNCKDEHGNAGN